VGGGGARGHRRLRPETFGNSQITSADRLGDIGAYLFETYRPTLLLLRTQPTTQVMQDPGWWTHPRKRRALAASDRAVGQILETVERLGLRDRTAFIVTGDHGMMSIHTQVRPNVPDGMLYSGLLQLLGGVHLWHPRCTRDARQFSNPATKTRSTADMTTILGWLIFGAVIGVLARFIMPGRDPIGWVMTILLGIAGSVVGGLLLGLIVGGRGTDPTGWIGSILGALLLLWLYRRYAGTRA
jgi:uncharacterized membrane protein YeaQ/YmgE (transglycosylase-associated protein family)